MIINYIKQEMCSQGVLEELINFSLKRNCGLVSSQSLIQASAVAQQQQQQQQQASQPTAANQTATTAAGAQPASQTPPSVASMLAASQQQLVQQRTYDRDIININYSLIRDNPVGSERFFMEKVDAFLAPIPSSVSSSGGLLADSNGSVASSLYQISSGGNAANSPVKHDMMLLIALAQKPDDSCWEMRLRLVIHSLLRSLSVAVCTNGRPNKQ